MTSTGALIPPKRLHRIPRHLRLAHEYAFFLHDQAARMLVEYEGAEAHFVKVRFKSKREGKVFNDLVDGGQHSLDALKALGYTKQAKRTILNAITMGMVSDCLHHVYEALICLEKRKVIVACNLLRKPLFDSLAYLSWMLGDEQDFYDAFTSGDPESLTHRKMGNRRLEILNAALRSTDVADIMQADFIQGAVYDAKSDYGLYGLFQHAVHLVTVDRIELRTSPENFNFIFANHTHDEIYERLYAVLPGLLLYLSHIILELYDRVKPMDRGAKAAFVARSKFGFHLVDGEPGSSIVRDGLGSALEGQCECSYCKEPVRVTEHNAARILLTDSFRCTKCRRVNGFAFSWAF